MHYKILPFPFDKDFAVTFVDDTDHSNRSNTEPVYDFLYQQGIKGTKTVWVNAQLRNSAYRKDLETAISPDQNSGSTLEEPDYRDFIFDLKAKGYEIALHNVAAGNSFRDEIIEGLNKFQTIFGKYPDINIFHERNIENLYAGKAKLDFWPFRLLEILTHRSDYLGHIEGSPYFWGDVAQRNIKFMRLPFHTITEVNTWKVNPSMPFFDPKRPYVNYWFANSAGADCYRFNKLLAPHNVAKLERENGICICYTHFANQFTVKKSGNRYELDGRFIDVIENLAQHENAWFPTVTELLERLLACKYIEIMHNGNEFVITNHGDTDLEGVCVGVKEAIDLIDEDGAKLKKTSRDALYFEMLPARSTMRYKASKVVRNIIIQPPKENAARYERIMIEIYNYYGLLRKKY